MTAEIIELEARRAELENCIRDCDLRVRTLRNQEDIPAGVFHAREIFEAQQEKLRMQTEILFLENRLRALRNPCVWRRPFVFARRAGAATKAQGCAFLRAGTVREGVALGLLA